MAYSIFLSHTSTDKPFVRKLAADLRAAGARVWLAEAEIKLGDSLLSKIEAGISETDYLGVVLSPNSVNSPWVQKEVNIALTKEIKGKRVTVLPILYKPCNMPGFLVDKLHADFTDDSNYLNALNLILEKLDLKSRRVQAEILIKTWVEEMGLKYSVTTDLPSIHGIIQVPKHAPGTIAVHIRTDKKEKATSLQGVNFVPIHLDPRELLKWKLLGLPVIVIWVSLPNELAAEASALWRSASFASSRSGRLRIPEKAVFNTKRTTRSLKGMTKEAWKPKIVSLSQSTLFPEKVSEIKRRAWDFYEQWREAGSVSPAFSRVDITLKAWRHMTRTTSSQKAIIHKLSLLPLAKELIETAQRGKCVRVLRGSPGEYTRREYHALRGVFISNHQADMVIEVILEMDKVFEIPRRIRFLSVHERRVWSD